MKILFKNILFIVLNILSNFIPIKQKVNFVNINILILLQKPLGLGDLAMLSPFTIKVIKKFKSNKIYIISEYNEFIEFENIIWIKPEQLEDTILSNSIVISPTLAFSNLKYILKAKYFLGYFISNKLISNISKIDFKYNPKTEHYLEKVFPILDIFNITYDSKQFDYPKIIAEKYDLNVDENIVIAPYSNWMERQYSFDNYMKLINKILIEHTYPIILIGSNAKDEIEFNNKIKERVNNNRVINITGKTSINKMNFLIKNCRLFIGNDSGPSNIAYLLAPKTLVLFGSVYFENRLPVNNELKDNILALDNRESCEYFPCYDGYNKPICRNTDKYSCLNVEISKDILKELLD